MYGNYNTGYGMNPYQQQLAQNRLNQMEQQYNVGTYQPNNYQMQNNQQMGTMQVLKGRPVSSYDEAKASMIDLDGTLFVFTDIANNCIYTKQILLDGSAELKTYVLQEQKQHSTHLEQSAETMSMQTRFVAEEYIIPMWQQILVCLLYLLVNCVRRGLISLQSLRRQCRCLIWEMTMDGLINGL